MWDLSGAVRGLLPIVSDRPGDDCPLSTCPFTNINDASLVFLRSGQQPHISYALSTQVARHRCVQAAMADGLSGMGYVCLPPPLHGVRDTRD